MVSAAARLRHESGWPAVVMDVYPALTSNVDPAPAS